VNAVRVMLGGIVDYAGLFPPAGLSMAHAVENYAEYKRGPHGWMLGRFVVPAARLPEFVRCWKKLPASTRGKPFDLSVLIGPDTDADVLRAQEFLDDSEDIGEIRSLELKAGTREAVAAAGLVCEELPEVFVVFLEVGAKEPGPLIAQIGSIGLCAKLRTGGVTADAFPTAREIVAFMRGCVDAGVAFKLTAGLHHAVCGKYPLTYNADAASAPMFGFLNVLLAAAVLSVRGGEDEALGILEERDPNAFRFEASAIAWHDLRIGTPSIQRMRARGVFSFGSCSFNEPVADLERMGAFA
jgi:hypothetical protein